MADRRGKMDGFIAIMVFLGIAVTGVAAGTAVNGTLVDGNGDAMRLLMTTSSKMFTKDACVESVSRGRTRENFFPASFPPLGFVPPGAEEWCACLEADPSGIASLSDTDFTTEAGREPFEQAFDRCKTSVLHGSDFNTADICRGMVGLFGLDLSTHYATFCGRICRRLEKDMYVDYGYGLQLSNLNGGCSSECSSSTMPGYCQKYKVWYTEWFDFFSAYTYGTVSRSVGVGDSRVGSQRSGFLGQRNIRTVAENLCNALYPLLGGNKNECCNYARSFRALEHCCALDSEGFSVFDCDKNFPAGSIENICMGQAEQSVSSGVGDGTSYCLFLRPDGESFENLQVWKQSSTGYYLFSFPESVQNYTCPVDDYYNIYGACCYAMNLMNISADCVDPSTLTYVGRTTKSLTGPTPGATEEEDPCLGMCEDGRECVESRNGAKFCVDCTAFLKPKRSGDLAECCTYSAEDRRCVTALKGISPGTCRRSDEIVLLADDGSRQSAQFRSSRGYPCGSLRDFRRNGAGCRVVVTKSGEVKCL